MFRENTTIANGIFIAIFSMIVVFLILLAISYLIDLIAFIVKKYFKDSASSKKAQKNSSQGATSNDETVAVITAAIAAYTGRDDFEVKSVQETGKASSWGVSAKVNSVN